MHNPISRELEGQSSAAYSFYEIRSVRRTYFCGQSRFVCREHRKWQEEVLSSLPRKADALGLTGPLRLAFADASDARKALLQEVMLAHGKFIEPACHDSCSESLHASS